MHLEDIGFYTLSEARAKSIRLTHHPLWRCELLVTPRCNFKCPYCRGTDMKHDISFDKAASIIGAWGDLGLKNIRFSGGEPTLHPDLTAMCCLAINKGIERIAVSTNGSAPIEIYMSLIKAGVNDFSVSLDACCSASGKKMCGVPGQWEKVLGNIEYLAKNTYTTVGIVVTPDNLKEVEGTIKLAHKLGVADIRVIPAAQCDQTLSLRIPKAILAAHPILNYRVFRFNQGCPVRGLSHSDSKQCHLVLDDMAVMGGYHYPCIIYLREKGKPIGKVGPAMMDERKAWSRTHNCLKDPICSKNCLDVCYMYNNRAEHYIKIAKGNL